MEEESNRSSAAFEEELYGNSKPSNEGEVENRGEKMERNYEERGVNSDRYSDCVGNSSRGDSGASKSETPAFVKVSHGDSPADFDESSHHLSGTSTIPGFYHFPMFKNKSQVIATYLYCFHVYL